MTLRLFSGLLAMLVLAACGPATPTASTATEQTQTPVSSESPSSPIAATPGASPSGTATRSLSPPPPERTVGWGDSVRVTTDGLAVRRSPGISAAFVSGWRFDNASGTWIRTSEELRIDTGHVLRVNLGPIVHGGIEWYRVANQPQPGDSDDEYIQWDADNDRAYGDFGWIAGSQDGTPFLEISADGPSLPDRRSGVFVDASGLNGSYTSDPFTLDFEGRVGGEWAYMTGDLAPCNLTMTLAPTGATLSSESLIGAFESGRMVSPVLAAGEYRLQVSAGVPDHPDAACPWALYLAFSTG